MVVLLKAQIDTDLTEKLRWGEWKNNFHSAFRMPHSGKFPFRIRELFGTTVLTVGAIIHSECRILEKSIPHYSTPPNAAK